MIMNRFETDSLFAKMEMDSRLRGNDSREYRISNKEQGTKNVEVKKRGNGIRKARDDRRHEKV